MNAAASPTRRPLLALAVLLAVALLSAWQLLDLRTRSDLGPFVTRDPLRIHLAAQLASPTVLFAVRAPDVAHSAALARKLGAALTSSGAFTYVAHGDPAQSRAELDAVRSLRYLLSDRITAASFSVAGLQRSLADAHQAMGTAEGPLVREWLAADPTLEALALIDRFALDDQALTVRQGVWFAPDGHHALVLAQPRVRAEDATGQRALADRLDDLVAKLVREESLQPASIRFSSTALVALAAREATQQAARVIGIGSGLLVLLLLAAVYRHALPVALCFVPAALGILAGVALTHAVFGGVHLLTIAFASILIGESVDYPAYALIQESHRDARSETWRSIVLATLTTAISALVLAWVGVPGLNQLAVLLLTGIVVAGVASRLLVFLIEGWVRGNRVVLPGWLQRSAAPLAAGGRSGGRRVVLLLLLAAATLLVVRQPAATTMALEAINPAPRAAIERERQLRALFGRDRPQQLLVVSGRDQDEVSKRLESLETDLARWREAGLIMNVRHAAYFLPSKARLQERLKVLPDESTLQIAMTRAQQDSPFRNVDFTPFVRAVQDNRALAGQGALRIAQYGTGLLGIGINGLLVPGTPLSHGLVVFEPGPQAQALPQQVAALGAAWAARGEPAPILIDPRAQLEQEVRGLERSLQQALMGCAALVLVCLVIARRSLRSGLVLTAIPALAAFCSFGVLGWVEPRIGLFHWVGLLLGFGVVTNYALFADQANREFQAKRIQAGQASVYSVLIVAASSLATFVLFALSGVTVLHALGLAVVLMVLYGLVICGLLAGYARTGQAS